MQPRQAILGLFAGGGCPGRCEALLYGVIEHLPVQVVEQLCKCTANSPARKVADSRFLAFTVGLHFQSQFAPHDRASLVYAHDMLIVTTSLLVTTHTYTHTHRPVWCCLMVRRLTGCRWTSQGTPCSSAPLGTQTSRCADFVCKRGGVLLARLGALPVKLATGLNSSTFCASTLHKWSASCQVQMPQPTIFNSFPTLATHMFQTKHTS